MNGHDYFREGVELLAQASTRGSVTPARAALVAEAQAHLTAALAWSALQAWTPEELTEEEPASGVIPETWTNGGYIADHGFVPEERDDHVHGDWDQGGYCNRLVVAADGSGDVCGFRQGDR